MWLSATAAFVRGQSREGVERASELEGPGALQVLALEEHLGARALVDRARGDDRGAMGGACDLPCRALDVSELQKAESALTCMSLIIG